MVLTHANLLANIRAIGEALRIAPRDVFVSWLPLYHDMGLISAWLASLYFGNPLLVMSPLAFLARPERWLWAIHRHRGTLTAAPNFAYELCLKRANDEQFITLTNLGDEGVETVHGVIHPPQVALVGFGRSAERPWVEDGKLCVRRTVTATLAADHRVSNGHRGALFLAEINRLLQSPEAL